MRSKNIIFISLSLLLTLASCRTSGDIKREKEITDIRQEISKVQTANADTGQNLDNVTDEIQKLKGEIEKVEHNRAQDKEDYSKVNEDLKQKIKDLETKIDKNYKELGERIDLMKKDFQDAVKKLEEVANAETKQAAATAASSDLKKKDLEDRYRKARKFHIAKNFTEAEKYYTSITGSKSKWYDERARFFLGTLMFDKGEYEKAVIKLQEFVDAYPNSQYVPVAMSIQAQCLLKIKKPKDAKVFLQDIISRFPKSKEAKEAKEKLKKL